LSLNFSKAGREYRTITLNLITVAVIT